MSTPQAKYVITADDRTAATWKSALGRAQKGGAAIAGAIRATLGTAAVAALTRAVTAGIEFGDAIGKAAAQAGIAVRPMSELAHAADMFDIELGTLSTSLQQLQQHLSEASTGSKRYLDTLRALGIELGDIRSLAADRQFEFIAQRISEMKDPADRTRAAVELFGDAGARLLPMFEQGAEGIRKAREEAERLGVALSEEQVRLLEEGDDAIKRLSAAWDGWMTSLATGTAKLAEAIDLIDKSPVEELKDQLADVERDLQRATMMPDGGPFDPETYKRLTAEAEKLKRQIAGMSVMQSRGGGYSRANFLHDDPPPGYTDEGATKEKDKSSTLDQFLATLEGINPGARDREQMRIAANTRSMIDDLDTDLRKFFADTDEANEKALENVELNFRETIETMSVFQEEAFRGMQQHFADFLFDPFEEGLDGMAKGFIDTIRRMLAEAASAKLFEALFGDKSSSGSSGGGIWGTVLSAVGSFFGGGKAEGGPLQPGKWHIAGEHGPEPIWGGGPGAFAMGYGGGGGNVTVSMPITMYNPTTDAVKQLRAEQPALIRHAVELAKAEMRDDRRRGRR